MPPAKTRPPLAEIKKKFHLPLKQACLELGVCRTLLKKCCRDYGIERWPYKKKYTKSTSAGSSYTQKERLRVLDEHSKWRRNYFFQTPIYRPVEHAFYHPVGHGVILLKESSVFAYHQPQYYHQQHYHHQYQAVPLIPVDAVSVKIPMRNIHSKRSCTIPTALIIQPQQQQAHHQHQSLPPPPPLPLPLQQQQQQQQQQQVHQKRYHPIIQHQVEKTRPLILRKVHKTTRRPQLAKPWMNQQHLLQQQQLQQEQHIQQRQLQLQQNQQRQLQQKLKQKLQQQQQHVRIQQRKPQPQQQRVFLDNQITKVHKPVPFKPNHTKNDVLVLNKINQKVDKDVIKVKNEVVTKDKEPAVIFKKGVFSPPALVEKSREKLPSFKELLKFVNK